MTERDYLLTIPCLAPSRDSEVFHIASVTEQAYTTIPFYYEYPILIVHVRVQMGFAA